MSALASMSNGKTEFFQNNFQNISFGKTEKVHMCSHSKMGYTCLPKHEEILFSGNNLQVNRYYYTDSKGALCSWVSSQLNNR